MAETTSDLDLVRRVRDGDAAGYHALYERHRTAANNLARHLTRDASLADDLVAEAFAKVLEAIRGNGGPEHAFRTYLLTTLRNVAYEHGRRNKRISFVDDDAVFERAGAVMDCGSTAPERSIIANAYRQLPERWRIVLWYTEVEGQSPATVALLLGMTPNGVSALSYRAREGLRQAYLRAHLASTQADRCKTAVDRLGAWARDGLSRRERSQVELHLDECVRCSVLAAELTEINTGMPAMIAAALLGTAGISYLTTANATSVGAGMSLAGLAKDGTPQLIGAATSGLAVAATVAIAVGLGPSDPPAAASLAPLGPPVSDVRRPIPPDAPLTDEPTPAPEPPVATTTAPPAPPRATSTRPAPTSTSPAPEPRSATSTPSPAAPYRWSFTTAVKSHGLPWSELVVTVPANAPVATPVIVDITPPLRSLIIRWRGPCEPHGSALRCTAQAGAGTALTVRVEILSPPSANPAAQVRLVADGQTVVRTVSLR